MSLISLNYIGRDHPTNTGDVTKNVMLHTPELAGDNCQL